MMRLGLYAAAALLALESAALACSCINTDDPVELKRFAAQAAEDAVALVEVEALTSYEGTGTGEQMKVIRTLAGSAPGQFRIERRGIPGSASCDVLYREGERAVVILYSSSEAGDGLATYRTSGLCMVHMLDKPIFLDTVRDRIGTPAQGDRG